MWQTEVQPCTLNYTNNVINGLHTFHVTDGELISPCRCSGSSKYVHTKCLAKWLVQRYKRDGPEGLLRCELCLQRYTLDGKVPIHIHPAQRAQYYITSQGRRIMQSPVGPCLRQLAGLAWLYSTTHAIMTLVTEAHLLPKMIIESRRNPRALLPMLPNVSAALMMETILLTNDYMFHIETVLFYGFGWLLDATVRNIETTWIPMLPPNLRSFLTAALVVPKSIGIAIQTFDLILMYIIGGGSAAFLDGMSTAATVPAILFTETSRFVTRFVQSLGVHFRKGFHLAFGALGTLIVRHSSR